MATSSNTRFKVSEIQLRYKNRIQPSDRPKVSCSTDAYQIFLESWDHNTLELKEEFKILILNRAHKVLGISLISSGGVSGTLVDPKLIFATALKANSCTIIMGHNHPSGNLVPSRADIQLTNKCVQAGKMLELPILDHLIITASGFYSLADEGLI